MGRIAGLRRYETYPEGVQPNRFGIPNEIVRYSFAITTAMAGTTQDPIANQLGATPQDSAAITNFAAVLFTAPGGHLTVGDLVVFNLGGNTGSPIDMQYSLHTIADPNLGNTPDGTVKTGVIDPTVSGIIGSQIDFSDVLVPPGGGVLSLQVIIPQVVISSSLVVSLSVGVDWNPATILLPPA